MTSCAHKLTGLALFVGGFLSAAYQFPAARFGAGYEIMNIARNLADHGAFANPFSSLPTGPTAICPPLYPLFLALLIRVFGYSAVFSLIVSGCTMAMHGLHAALLPSVSQLFFAERRPGICAAVITIAFPMFYFLPQFESMYIAVGLMFFCLVSGRLSGLSAGLLAGLLALLNPATIAIAGLWLLYTNWRRKGVIKFLVWTTAGAMLVVLPWIWRNYREFHMLIPVRDNMGLELYVSNNDFAGPSFNANGESRLRRHPSGSMEEARRLRDMGEANYNRDRQAAALDWIRTHRTHFFELTATRARLFWFSDPADGPLHYWPIALTTVAAALGVVLLALRRRPTAIFIAAVWLCYPLLYYVTQYDSRYRVPIEWLSLLGAGYLLSSVWDRLQFIRRESRRKVRTPAREERQNALISCRRVLSDWRDPAPDHAGGPPDGDTPAPRHGWCPRWAPYWQSRA